MDINSCEVESDLETYGHSDLPFTILVWCILREGARIGDDTFHTSVKTLPTSFRERWEGFCWRNVDSGPRRMIVCIMKDSDVRGAKWEVLNINIYYIRFVELAINTTAQTFYCILYK